MKRTSVLAMSAIAAFAISAIESGAKAQNSWSQTPTYAFPQTLFGAGWFSPLRNGNYAGAQDFQSGSNKPAPANQSGGMCRRRGPAHGLESQRNGFYGF